MAKKTAPVLVEVLGPTISTFLRSFSPAPWRCRAGQEDHEFKTFDPVIHWCNTQIPRRNSVLVRLPQNYLAVRAPMDTPSSHLRPCPTQVISIARGQTYLLWRLSDRVDVATGTRLSCDLAAQCGSDCEGWYDGHVPLPGTMVFVRTGVGLSHMARAMVLSSISGSYHVEGGRIVVPPPDLAKAAAPLTVCATDIKPRRIDWLWPGVIPLGEMTLLGGSPGMGKSQIGYSLAGVVTRGGGWPTGEIAERGRVLVCETEDDPEQIIVPRLIAAGADMRRVAIGRRMDLSQPHERAALEVELKRIGDVRLMIASPVRSFFGREEARGDVAFRDTLEAVVALARKHRLAVLGITHPPKEKQYAADGFGGSEELLRAVRSAWSATPVGMKRGVNPRSCPRVLQAGKVNVARDDVVLGYDIVDALAGDIVTSRISWKVSQVERSEGSENVVPLRKRTTRKGSSVE